MIIYSIFGYGKMKTESAIGITIRAVQNGDKVLFTQFLKDGSSSEIDFLDSLDSVTTLSSEVKKITLPQNVSTRDNAYAQILFSSCYDSISSGEFNLIVLDEILPTVDMGLITLEQLKLLIKLCRANKVDMYLTGRIRSKELRDKIVSISDICTNAYCVKHNFDTYCEQCKNSYKYHYTYCPDCGNELIPSQKVKKGRDF